MSAKEIIRLRRKFIIIAMATFGLVMLFICTAVNATTITVNRVSIMSTLNRISAVDSDDIENIIDTFYDPEGDMPTIVDIFSTNNRQNRLFVFLYDENGQTERTAFTTNNQNEIRNANAAAEAVMQDISQSGRHNVYYFRKNVRSGGGTFLVMIDASSEIFTALLVLLSTAGVFIIAFIITFVIVMFLSGKMIQPEIENSYRQKEFITNASHELKTPLAVIRANTECTEMISGESEWTKSTLAQVDHLNGMIQNLVMIARAQEKENKSEMSEINVSEAVDGSVSPYEAMTVQAGLTLVREIEPDVTMIADESNIRQLTAILIDNAVKYCDENGTITVALSGTRKGAILSVCNSYAEGENVDYSHFFDRFYREDKSHNIDKGGYGIGLSIAESICSQMGGSISASWKDGIISFNCVLK